MGNKILLKKNIWLSQKVSGIVFRLQNLRYGIIFGSMSKYTVPSKIWIRGRYRELFFNFQNLEAFNYEFRSICLEDCYQLKKINKKIKVSTIVDIGANQGLFLLAARKHFPKSDLSAYEPNKELEKILINNGIALNAKVYMEAVSDRDEKMKLQLGKTDLHSVAISSTEGDIPAVSFAKVLQRESKKIDLVKLDCEGGEWPLLEIPEFWNSVGAITMEYHLWANPNSSVEKLVLKINELGFDIISLSQISKTFGLLSAIRQNKN